MKGIYIDLGCYDGTTINEFKRWRHLVNIDSEWKIYGFDPNPRFYDTWKKIPNATIEAKAAWIFDGKIEFTLRPENAPFGSTVMREKVDWGMGEILTVECFDFSKWLKQFELDYVIIKCDCEGAEFPILTKMIKDGTDLIPDQTFVEWHDTKLSSETNKNWIMDNYRSELIEWS